MTGKLRLIFATVSTLAGLLFLCSPGAAAATNHAKPNTTTSCSGGAVLLDHSDGAVSVEAPSGCAAPAFLGSMGGKSLNAPIVGMATTPDGGGYWLVASDGGVFTFGDARYYGSTGNLKLNDPVVGMATTPDGGGYWLVASDGGVFTFGDAGYYGSTGALRLNKPVVGIATDGATGGYWLVASDGGVFAFNAPFLGSMGATRLNAPVKFITGTPDFGGYRMVGADGGVFNFGDAQYYGSAANLPGKTWQALAPSPDGGGYWLFSNSSGGETVSIVSYGDASSSLVSSGGDADDSPIVGAAASSIAAPTVTANPSSQTVASGASVSFTAAASGSTGVQWQESTDGGATFSSISGATSTTLTFTAATADDGNEYQAVFTNPGGSTASAVATLTVTTPIAAPTVTANPSSQTVASGASVSFTAAASGSTGVQWQESTDGGATFSSISGATSTTLTFTAATADDGNEYQAVFTNAGGSTATAVATLIVIPPGDIVPSSAGGYFADISCPTTSECVTVGETSGHLALIETSENGGNTFNVVPVPPAAPPLVSVDCNDPTHCVAVGKSSAMVSNDGGQTWALDATPLAGDSDVSLLGVACGSDTLCTAVGTPAQYLYSHDGGATWNNSTPFAGGSLTMGAVTCDATRCIAVGESGALSTDGGETWTETTGVDLPLSVSCGDGGTTCLAVGPNSGGLFDPTDMGNVSVSSDGGTSWTLQGSDLPASTATIQDVSCGDSTDCMVVGPSPTLGASLVIATTSDSGSSWSSFTGPTGFRYPPSNLGSVAYPTVSCTSSTACIIVGGTSSGPLVSVTANGGQSWSTATVQ